MLGIRFVLAVLAASVVTSMTDWLFMGDWVYKRFDKHPEIWRVQGRQAELKAIAWSTVLPFVTCAVFDFLCVHRETFTRSSTFTLAVGTWLAVALPMIITNSIWMKITAPIAALFSVGWLVKLLVAGSLLLLIVR